MTVDSSTLDADLVTLVAARNIGALATIRGDGRPQLSSVNFTFDPSTESARVSVIADRAIVSNLRRDPRASIYVASPDGWTYAVLEGSVELSSVASTPFDDIVEELLEVYRAILGQSPPSSDDFRAAMVDDRRLVATLRVDSVYGLAGPVASIPA